MKKYYVKGPQRRRLAKDGWKKFNEGMSARERGYDHTWDKLRAAYVAQNPLCELCLKKKRKQITPVAQVDHKIPFQGIMDPLRLDWDNLQSICIPCHRRKEKGYERYKKKIQ